MSTSEHTPGPWEWEEANHTGVYETSTPRTLVSSSTRHFRLRDGKDIGRKPVLIPLASTTAQVAGVIDAISLEIHGTKADELLIAAAPDLLAACEQVLGYLQRISGRGVVVSNNEEAAQLRADIIRLSLEKVPVLLQQLGAAIAKAKPAP